MALTADDILGNPAVGACVRRLAQALLMIHDASPRLASLFGTRQRWLMAHAAVAQYFRDVGAAGSGAGLSMARLLDLVERYEVASRNTAAAFLKEMLKYDIVRHVAASEGKRHRTFEPAPTTLAALFQWHVLHLATLDGIDGGTIERRTGGPATFAAFDCRRHLGRQHGPQAGADLCAVRLGR